MNILFLTNKSSYQDGVFGGAESSIRLLAQHLIRTGHSVEYVTKDRSGRLRPKLKSHNVEGLNLHVFHTTYGYRRNQFIRKFNDHFLEQHVLSLVERKDIHIAYCFYEIENVLLLLRISEELGYPKVVMRMAGIQWYDMCQRNSYLIAIYNDIFSRINAVNFISSGLQEMVDDRMLELHMDAKFKYSFVADIGSSITPGRLEPYESLEPEPFKLIMATRFSNYQTRQDILVRAISLLHDDINIQLKFIGSGGNLTKIKKLVDELGINNNVEFVPFLQQDELWCELARTHLLCHACDYEGLGKIIIESMAIGLPVLVSDVLPLNTFIRDADNGFLVDNVPEKWAARILKLAADRRIRAAVSTNSIEWIKSNYDPAQNVYEYIRHFNYICGIITL